MTNESQRAYYPLFADLRGRKVLVVGGGSVAERKIQSFLEAGAKVAVVAPQTTAAITGLASKGRIALHARTFASHDMENAWLVVAATDDPEVQRAVYAEAERRHILCNTVDQPELCSFIVPSVVRRGDLAIAISTSGKSPALAKRLRKAFEEQFQTCYAEYLALLGDLRQHLISAEPDPEARKGLCQTLAEPEVLEWMAQGNWERVEQWAGNICGPEAARHIVGRHKGAKPRTEAT